MRSSTAVCSSIFVLALAAPALWSDDASAVMPPPVCGDLCETCVTTPARYTAGAAGTVALTANSGSTASAALAPLIAAINGTYYHAVALYDASGNHFTEAEWNGATPPASNTTGEPHVCSRLISPFYLQNLSPGAVTDIYEDAVVPATLIAGFATAACSVPRDGYHLNSFRNDAIPGGSCEHLLEDYCGVPVKDALISAGGDRVAYNATEMWNVVNGSAGPYYDAYNACMGTISGSYITILGIGGIGCGGSSEQTMCQRAGWQAVNELMFPAYPIAGCPAGDGNCSFEDGPLAPGGAYYYLDGWSDFHTVGTAPPVVGSYPPPGYNTWTGNMLGAGKMNYESNGAQGGLCPGANNTTGANNFPLACPEYQVSSWTLNAPDNIEHAATRLGKAQVSVTSTSGYAASYQTCNLTYCCKEP